MKKTIITAILAAMTLLLIGCSANNERIDLTDPLSGSSILSAADLEAFFKYGENDTAVLAASFSMEDTMLKLTAQRGSITIDGNGYTLSGTGDCIIRLDEGCKLTLNDITVHSGSTAIGCLGSAEIGGENANIIGVSDGILCADELIVSEGSSLVCKGSNGRGIDAEDITIKDLAERALLSPYHFIRTFKKQVGFTPHEYLVNTRINTARYLLKNTSMSTKDICFHCGFSSESVFCNAFKKNTTMTPSEYRSDCS